MLRRDREGGRGKEGGRWCEVAGSPTICLQTASGERLAWQAGSQAVTRGLDLVRPRSERGRLPSCELPASRGPWACPWLRPGLARGPHPCLVSGWLRWSASSPRTTVCPRHSLSSGGNQLHPDPKVVGPRGGTRAGWHQGGGTPELGQIPREVEGELSAWVLTVPGEGSGHPRGQAGSVPT